MIRPGLTDREFDVVEQRFGFCFADDHRALLAEGLPVWTEGDDDPDKTTDLGWPDWRDGDPGRLREHLTSPSKARLHASGTATGIRGGATIGLRKPVMRCRLRGSA